MRDLNIQLENLLQNGASDFQVSKLFKEEIKRYYEELPKSLLNPTARTFLHQHTRALEEIMIGFVKYVIRDSFRDYRPPINSIPLALIALGSFGREELTAYSDVDIMIVYKDIKGFNLTPLIERVLYLAWDAGLKLGHRVHEINELENGANEDITIKTAMIESRFFFGSRFLWMEVENKLNRIRKHNQSDFIAKKLAEKNHRYKTRPIIMEPNLKEGVGGMRDANTLYWIANVLFSIDSTKDLLGKVFDEEYYREYSISLDFIYKVRSVLHLVANKHQDNLLFQYQRELAIKLGFKDIKTRSAERQFMKKMFASMETVSRISTFYTAKILEDQHCACNEIKKLDENFWICNKKLYSKYESFHLKLIDILKLIVTLEEYTDFDITAITAFNNSKKGSYSHKKSKKYIVDIFSRKDCAKIIKALFDASILDEIISPLKAITHLAQFDGYHKMTVDRHSVHTLEYLEALQQGHQSEILDSLSKDDKVLLRLVALLHDTGKGRLSDHSIIGSKVFRVFASSIDLSLELVEKGAILIRFHTLMSRVAQKEDLYSQKVLLSFVANIYDKNLLDMLYLLTIADMKAVDSNVYSDFVAGLLKELYLNSIPLLEKEEQITEVSKRLRKEKILKTTDAFLNLPLTLQNKILRVESNLFFLKFRSDEIISLSKKADETKKYSYEYENEKYFILKIFTKIPINLGWLLGKLSWLDLASMDIFKLSVGNKIFLMSFREKIDEQSIFFLEELLENSTDMSKKLNYETPIIYKKDIDYDCDHAPGYARFTLNTQDQKGLMAYIIDIFDQFQIDIATAKISTTKRRANDLFLIEKNGNFCDNADEVMKMLLKGSK